MEVQPLGAARTHDGPADEEQGHYSKADLSNSNVYQLHAPTIAGEQGYLYCTSLVSLGASGLWWHHASR